MIILLATFVLLALYVGLVAALGQSERGLALWLKSTVIAVAARIGLLWLLLALHWQGLLGLWAPKCCTREARSLLTGPVAASSHPR